MANGSGLGRVDRFAPISVQEGNAGVRPSVRALLDQIDTTDEAFPRVAALLAEMVDAGVELDASAIAIAVRLAKKAKPEPPKRKHAQLNSALPMWTPTGDESSIVYYIRRGALVKIGTTTRPRRRFEALLPDEIMAIEPGDRSIEAARHRQFRHLRQSDMEYFTQAADLSAHIRRMRAMHGEPDPAWRTTANIAETRHRPVLPAALPPLVSKETVTVAEAAKILGIKFGTVETWATRRRVPLAGLTEDGLHVYYLDHLKALASHSRPKSGRRSKS